MYVYDNIPLKSSQNKKYFRKKAVETIKTQIFSITNVGKSSHLLDNVKDMVERYRPQMTIWRKRSAFWITKTENTHSECVILIAFPR